MPDTTLQEIREILKELSLSQMETDAKFKEMKREMAERDKITEKRIDEAFDLFDAQ